jgi:hypothetical protein
VLRTGFANAQNTSTVSIFLSFNIFYPNQISAQPVAMGSITFYGDQDH